MDFGLVDDRSKTGYYAGFLGAAFMVGRGISSPFWGHAMDKYGRKPTLSVALFCITVGTLLFGLSPNYAWALVSRLVTGLFAPIPAVCKTAVSELSPPDKTKFSMSVFTIGWSVGLVLGSGVGGVLAHPENLGIATSGIFVDYPYLLPNFVIALMSFLDLVLVVLYFQETLHESDRQSPASQGDMASLLGEESIRQVLIIYSIQSINQTLYAEILPLWCWSSVENGGLNFDPHEIGLLLTAAYLIVIVFSQGLYEKLANANGLRWIVTCSSVISAPIVILLPFVNLIVEYKLLTWVVLVSVCTFYSYLNYQIFNAQFLLLNNTVERARRGRVNGIGMSIGSISKAVGPFIGGPLFALTSTEGFLYPFDYTFTFNLLACGFGAQYWVTKKLPAALEDNPD
eukprot:CAMPEP_0204907500 /NCGR_PEP_ID=MMETSP1397-20131031/6637_1 /ASSEMBLY_ACC=CAM_ASM_000891 /TAXON_ID=49980 /ORGANISM="Climacostomum Climacostomum virens, Strain Stock W-24" /LENGTH=398 /DNA_ID=CAMNT_0052076677 /DNA_START=237 /DNA_END=1430 /DNA_ORIENTATION=-